MTENRQFQKSPNLFRELMNSLLWEKMKLFEACESGDIKKVKKIVAKNPKFLNTTDSNGNSSLMHAVLNDQSKIVEFLIAQPDLEINYKNSEGFTALDLACHRQNFNIIAILLNHKKIKISSEKRELSLDQDKELSPKTNKPELQNISQQHFLLSDMSKEYNSDPISNSGNLRMNHVLWLFQTLVINHEISKIKQKDKIEKEDILENEIGKNFDRKFGEMIIFSNAKEALNLHLNEAIKNFAEGKEALPQDFKPDHDSNLNFTISKNKSFILISHDDFENLGTEFETPTTNDFIPTHFTVLNLRRNEQGEIEVRYADSLHDGNEVIPDKIEEALKKNGIERNKEVFLHDSQGKTSDCGYHAVFNALKLLEINPFPDEIKTFVTMQRERLKEIFGKEDILYFENWPQPSVFDDRDSQLQKSAEEFFEAYYNYEKDPEKITKMIENDPLCLDIEDEEGYPILLVAVDDANLSFLKFILKKKELSVNAKNPEGYTALHMICDPDNSFEEESPERIETLKLLLSRQDIDIYAEDDDGRTPIQILKKDKGKVEKKILELLLEHEKKYPPITIIEEDTEYQEGKNINFPEVIPLSENRSHLKRQGEEYPKKDVRRKLFEDPVELLDEIKPVEKPSYINEVVTSAKEGNFDHFKELLKKSSETDLEVLIEKFSAENQTENEVLALRELLEWLEKNQDKEKSSPSESPSPKLNTSPKNSLDKHI